MPRSYRSLGFAALVALALVSFGLGAFTIALGYPEQQQRYERNQSGDKNKVGSPTTVTDLTSSGMQNTPCKNPQTETERDLCQQWRAANAAEKSAQWAVFGVIASIIGISLLLWQIMLTREAVQDTGRATDAMREANIIAREVNRPFVTTVPLIDHCEVSGGYLCLTMRFVFENIGATIATGFLPRAEPFFVNQSFEKPSAFFKSARKGFSENSPFLMPGEKHTLILKNNYLIDEIPWFSATDGEKVWFLICLSVTYQPLGKYEPRQQLFTQETFRVGVSKYDAVKRRWLYRDDLNTISAQDFVFIPDHFRNRR